MKRKAEDDDEEEVPAPAVAARRPTPQDALLVAMARKIVEQRDMIQGLRQQMHQLSGTVYTIFVDLKVRITILFRPESSKCLSVCMQVPFEDDPEIGLFFARDWDRDKRLKGLKCAVDAETANALTLYQFIDLLLFHVFSDAYKERHHCGIGP